MGSYWVYVWSILGLCFGYFLDIFVSRYLKLLKFSVKSHASQIEEYSLMLNFWYYILAMSGPYWGHVLAISTISLLLYALIG